MANEQPQRESVFYRSFTVHGDFVTNIARERCYQEGDPGAALELVMSATMTDQVSYEERLGIAIQILDGKAEITGVSGVDYGLEPTPDNPSLGFFDKLKELPQTIKELKAQIDDVNRRFAFVLDQLDLPDYKLRNLNAKYRECYGQLLFHGVGQSLLDQYGDNVFPDAGPASRMLADYLDKSRKEKELGYDPEKDYGWLEPNGEYHPVPWGDHSKWATDYLNEHYPDDDPSDPEHSVYWKLDQNGEWKYYTAGDCLVYCLGWILIDSPYQGSPRHTCDPSRNMTRAQKEFLFMHYTERGMSEEASALYAEED